MVGRSPRYELIGNKQRSHLERPRQPTRARVLIIICAHNEARLLPDLLGAIRQNDILVVDDGSTDGTGNLACARGATVLVHQKRLGKAASLQDAIDFALDNGYEIVIEMGADAIPEEGVIEQLIRELDSSDIAAASIKQVPVGPMNVAYRIDELMWATLAHGKRLQMSRDGTAHLGGVMYAFKPECVSSVEGSVNDDEQLGLCIRVRGYRTSFVDTSSVYFDASSSVGHVMQRRRRMYYGHMLYARSTAPSMEIGIVASALVQSMAEKPSRLPWAIPAILLDLISRLFAWRDARDERNRSRYAKWVTTYEKNLVARSMRVSR